MLDHNRLKARQRIAAQLVNVVDAMARTDLSHLTYAEATGYWAIFKSMEDYLSEFKIREGQ